MIKKILVPLDGSVDPTSALAVAAGIAELSHASLTCLVIQDQSRFVHLSLPLAIAETLTGEAVTATPLSAEEMIVQEERFEEELRYMRERFRALTADRALNTEFETLRGLPGEVLRNAARGADFVVISGHFRHGYSESADLHGLLRGITRPILVVPDDTQGASRLVLAYDASAASDRAVRAAAELATIMQLEEIHIVSVTSEPEYFEPLHNQLLGYYQAYGLQPKSVMLKGRPDELIANYAKEVDATVLALGAFGSTALSETIFGSTTAAVLREAQTAVLLIG